MGLTGRTGLLMLSALGGDRDRDRDRDRDVFRFQVLPGAGDTLTLAVEVVAGSPEPTWHFHDGTTQTGLSVTKAYAAAGTYPVILRLPGLCARISRLDFAGQPVKFDLAQLRTWTALTRIDAYSNAATVITGQLRDLPPAMTTLDLGSTSSAITGSLADLPATMEYLVLGDTSSAITGALADLPATMTTLVMDSTSSAITGALVDLPPAMEFLYLHGTSSTITGSLADLPATMMALDLGGTSSTITPGVGVRARAICELYLDSTGMSQAAVDAIAEWLYINRALFTYATPSANLGGTNAAPSGIYQDADPPTTGKEYIYKVENDPEGEGFNKWTVAYTA